MNIFINKSGFIKTFTIKYTKCMKKNSTTTYTTVHSVVLLYYIMLFCAIANKTHKIIKSAV